MRAPHRLLRLNVGWVEVMVIPSEGRPFALVDAGLASRPLRRLDDLATFSGEGQYRNAPDAGRASSAPEQFSTIYGPLLDAHREAIQTAGRPVRRYVWERSHSEAAMAYLRQFLKMDLPSPEYVDGTSGEAERVAAQITEAREGRERLKVHRHRERDKRLVAEAKRLAAEAPEGLACRVCGFDFARAYGVLGEGFCEVHHTVPLSNYDDEGQTTRVEDLAVVCANCHRMLHHSAQPSVAKVRSIVTKRRASQ